VSIYDFETFALTLCLPVFQFLARIVLTLQRVPRLKRNMRYAVFATGISSPVAIRLVSPTFKDTVMQQYLSQQVYRIRYESRRSSKPNLHFKKQKK